jgi:hypothetical protein
MTPKELDELERLKEPQHAMLSLISDLADYDTDIASAVTRRFQWYEERAVELIQAAARERDALLEAATDYAFLSRRSTEDMTDAEFYGEHQTDLENAKQKLFALVDGSDHE